MRSALTSLALTACLATSCAPAIAPIPQAGAAPTIETLLASASSARSVDQPLILFGGSDTEREVVPIRYERGVDETVRWEGAGPGAAVLTNAFGQVVYRVEEGGPAFEGPIPAGEYTLTVDRGAAAGLPLYMDVDAQGLAHVRSFVELASPGEVTRANWNQHRLGEYGPNFDGWSFDGEPLERAYLTAPYSFRGANFSGAIIEGVTFDGVDLRNAKFAGVRKLWATFKNCDLRGADLSGLQMDYLRFIGCDLRDAKLVGSYNIHMNFTESNMEGADLSRAHFIGGDFARANMRGVKLVEAQLAMPGFQDADLTGADLSDAMIIVVRMDRANLTNARFDGAKLQHVIFTDAILTGATGL